MCHNGRYAERGINRSTGSCPSDGGRAGLLRRDGTVARPPGGAARADHRGGKGLGAGLGHASPGVLGAASGAHRRCRPDRMFAAMIAVEHDPTSTSSTGSRGRQATARARRRCHLPLRGDPDIGFDPDVIIECAGIGHDHRLDRRGQRQRVVCLGAWAAAGRQAALTRRCGQGAGPGQQHRRRSVNANRRHFYRAAEALAAADQVWLAG